MRFPVSVDKSGNDAVNGRYLWHLGSFLLLIILALCGLYCFTNGFLLKRVELPVRSSCPENLAEDGVCYRHLVPKFKRSVILLVDALKFEFLASGVPLQDQAKAYHNKVPVVTNLIRNQPENAALFRFIADAPTTTMQRIKGLTTGSLPTFIDISLNFAASSIVEDNIVDQARQLGKNVTFMGDDTWMNLYPTSFTKSFPFPSFDVKDLNTVDRGVWEHLLPEMRLKDSALLIAHMLGVDHCGHRYGPNHPEMARKLGELNGYIRNIVREMDEETVLFVMGDHGMTKTGDHGGDSLDEVEAALFVYSPQSFLNAGPSVATISQVDFVPTLSLLMGHPIPFSSLGRIIPSMFATTSSQHSPLSSQRTAFDLNADQVLNFLHSYSKVSSDIPARELESLERSYETAKNYSTLASYLDFFEGTLNVCQSIWAKFDERKIWLGVLFVGASAFGLTLILLLTAGLVWIRDFYAAFAVAVGTLHALSMFSNSFQVREDMTVMCILQTLVWLHFLRTFQRSRHSWWYIIRFVALTVSLRSLEVVRRCREEQLECDVSIFAMGTEFADSPSYLHHARLAFGLMTTGGMFFWVMKKVCTEVKRNGIWNGIFSWMLGICAFSLMVNLVITDQPSIRQVVLPRFVYGMAISSMVHLFASPVFMTGNRRFRQVTSMNGNHHLSKYPQSATENNFTNVDTFFSDFSSLLVLPIVFVITLFLGEVWGFQLVLIFMLLHQHLTEPKPTNSVVFVVAWFFASWHLFFSTGHQTAFPVLHWNAAFFGVESADVSSPILPAMVMCLETFGGQIVMAMSLPSLMQSDRNDSLWLRSSAEFYVDLWRLFLGYLLCHSGKLFIVMLNAAVNRRHLMVWKIFAPRFMFEGISFLLTCLCLVIGYVYSIRAFNSALRFAVENEVPLDLYQRKRSRDSEKGSRKRR